MDILSVDSLPVSVSARQSSGGPQVSAPASNPASPKISVPTAENVTASPAPEAIAKAIRSVNDRFSQMGSDLYTSFQKDKTTGFEVIQFHDKSTDGVIRQIPSKQMLAIAQSLADLSGTQGLLLHEKV